MINLKVSLSIKYFINLFFIILVIKVKSKILFVKKNKVVKLIMFKRKIKL